MEDLVFYYQDLKPHIIRVLSLSKDAIHIHLGFIAFMATSYFTRKPLRDGKLLIPVLVLSLVMEALDFMSDIYDGRGFLWSWYLHDLINTNFIPLMIVAFHRYYIRQDNAPR